MTLWRLATHAHLDGTGGLYADGRWHRQGFRVIYTAESAAGALLEVRVHLEVDDEDLPNDYVMLEIEVPAAALIEPFDTGTLPPDWVSRPDVTVDIGTKWLASLRSPALRVPSAILPATWNVLLNPSHPALADMRLVQSRSIDLDPRLLR